jgi:predicted transcriptional regulator
MSRVQGQHKTETEKAQELYEKQAAKCERMVQRRDELQAQLDEINDQLSTELELVAYYKAHPLLKTYEAQLQADYEEQFTEPELPFEEPKNITFKGIKGRAVLQGSPDIK